MCIGSGFGYTKISSKTVLHSEMEYVFKFCLTDAKNLFPGSFSDYCETKH